MRGLLVSNKVYQGNGCGDSPVKGIDGGGRWCAIGMGKVGVIGHLGDAIVAWGGSLEGY